MKHLKTFNESNTDEYYQEIDRAEHFSLLYKPGGLGLSARVNFTNDEFELVKNIISEIPGTIKISCLNHNIKAKIENKSIDETDILCSIIKCEDEWYYVSLLDDPNDFHTARFINRNKERQRSYYKCDQFEGLLKLLKRYI